MRGGLVTDAKMLIQHITADERSSWLPRPKLLSPSWMPLGWAAKMPILYLALVIQALNKLSDLYNCQQGSSAVLASLCHASMLAALVSTTATMCVSPPFFVCLASPSILLVFFCVFYFALPQLCTLLGFFSFSWFPFFGSDSPWAASFCFLLCLSPPSSFFCCLSGPCWGP